jgi:hypothetical protein
MSAPDISKLGRALMVPESVWPEAGIFLMLLVLLGLQLYTFYGLGWNAIATLSVLVAVLVNGYWFGRSLGKRILHDEGSQIVAEKVFCGLHFARVAIPKTEIEKVGVQVIQRRANKNKVRLKFYRLSTKPDLTINASLKGQDATVEFVEQARRFVDDWSTLETRTIDAAH